MMIVIPKSLRKNKRTTRISLHLGHPFNLILVSMNHLMIVRMRKEMRLRVFRS
ncbi:hypothetical protein RHGRI_002083 [Rhododendron griersonianum]|uniref:Uncharacterized protein n=1 Tax=Rhododendron griersonianum TaxID=479676 RepID=A0AAV6K8A0_9ERIC|nr:hypothetical protein RHGRI_028933 [Rhododendron griersonianum]KAG5535394.1 hypothetical protein RHGRI_023226 [Rhododendron griersonianum]KAG5548706.1 hypothetical protein RHGRI_014156 [Rhododendron griersonianum]KAG5566372.1 hypothetical protein RHGRI_002083 [Rhododendron griersonianum]